MKIKYSLVVITIIAMLSLVAFSQTNTNVAADAVTVVTNGTGSEIISTNAPPIPAPGTTPGSPDVAVFENASEAINLILMGLIGVISPMLVRLIATLAPAIPTRVLPLIGPALVFAINWISEIAGGPNVHPMIALGLGALGNGLREGKEVFVSEETKRQRKVAAKAKTSSLPLPLILLCGALAFGVTGCKGPMGPSIVRTGVGSGVAYSTLKYPQAVPYLRLAAPVICSAAVGTNLSPAEVIAAIEASPQAGAIKTPEGVLILNGALTLYTALWQGYGEDAVKNSPQLRLYLQATCDGIHDGLMGMPTLRAKRAVPQFSQWPLVKY